MIVYCPTCHQPGRIVSHSMHEVECPACFSKFSVEPISAETDTNIVTFKAVNDSAEGSSLPDSNEYDLDAQGSLLESDYAQATSALEPLDLTAEVQEVIEAKSNVAAPIKFSLDNKPSGKTRKKEKSGIGSMLGVVLGGFASLPIATAIMWYGMGKDPFQVGPKVAKYVPWIVPDRFAGRYGSSSRSFPPLNQPGSSSYFTDDSLKKQHNDSSDFGQDLSNAYSPKDTNSKSDQQSSPETGRHKDPDSAPPASLPAEVMAFSEVTPNVVTLPTEVSPEVELPFKPDSEAEPLNPDLVQYQLNVVKAIDELSAESDSLAFGKFLEDLQLLLSHLDPGTVTDSSLRQLSGLANKLDSIKTAPFLKGLVTESRSRLTQSSGETSNEISYIDVFELESTSNLDALEALPKLSENYEVWLPSNNTKEPVRSLKVLCPRGTSQANESKNSRYILVGRVIKLDGIDERVFLVHFVVPL